MIKKREAAVFVLALLLGLAGRAAWRRWAAPSGDASAPALGLTPPDPNDKGLIGSIFSRPTVSYAPVSLPALPAPGDDRELADRPAASAAGGPESGGGRVGLGDASDLGGAAGGAPAAPPAAAGPPRWQMPADSASSPSRPVTGSGAPATDRVLPPNEGPSHLPSPTLRRLRRKVGQADRPVVNMSGVSDRAANAIPTPTASPLTAYPAAGGDSPATTPADGAAPAGDVPPAAPAAASGGVAALGDDTVTPAAAAAAPAVADPSSTTDGASAADEGVADLTPIIGAPQLAEGTRGVVVKPSGFFFSARKGAAATVQPLLVSVGRAKAVEYTSAMRVDADGAGGWYLKDKSGHPTTTLKYSPTESLDPGRIPYIVLPKGFNKEFPGVRLGDYAAVTYGGKTLYAVVGDIGLPGVLGAGSIALASGLGIDPDPKTGGASGGVTYVILAGSRPPAPARDAQTIQTEGGRAFAAAGISLQ